MTAWHLTRCADCGEFVHPIFDYCEHLDKYLCDPCLDEHEDHFNPPPKGD